MKCPKCNFDNPKTANFCNGCGEVLLNKNDITEAKVENEKKEIGIIKIIKLIIQTLTKPVTAIEENGSDIDNLKISSIIAVSISLISTFATLIKIMISSVFVKEYIFLQGTKTVVKMENLLKINYIGTIVKYFVIYLGIIAFISTVYFIASLIVRKKVKFSRLFGIASISLIPIYIVLTVVTPILSIFTQYFSIVFAMISFAYSMVILMYLFNRELKLEGNKIIYTNFACITVFLMTIYITISIIIQNTIGFLTKLM